LSERLGEIHQTTKTVKFWRIIIGPWLRYFIDAVFDRYETLKLASETNGFSDTLLLQYEIDDCIPNNFSEFYNQFREDPWNHIIFAECIKFMNLPYTEISIPLESSKNLVSIESSSKSVSRKVLEKLSRLIPSWLNKAVFVAAYLPKSQLAQLQLKLGQLPYLESPDINLQRPVVDSVKRDGLIYSANTTDFEQFLCGLISKFIPFAYLESYKSWQEEALRQFPSQPKLIITANAYQNDDGFKMWTAYHHVVKNIPYIIVQHGGHYGISKAYQTEDHQIASSGNFASWGWDQKGDSNVVPMPALKVPGGEIPYKPDGDILLLLASLPRYFYCHFSFPVAGQFIKYLENQRALISLLSTESLGEVKIRLDVDIFGWNIKERMEHYGYGHMLEEIKTPLYSRLRNCKLAVSSYNATIFLETLAMNFPTVVYLDPHFFEIRDEAIQDMDLLKRVKILHETPESAADHINAIESEVDTWWESTDVQEARRIFCKKFVNTCPNRFQEWATYLKKTLNHYQGSLSN
jgi:putative transferase (TIGR04331 family)